MSSPIADLALQPPKVNFAPGAEYGAEARRWQGIPSIERTAGGRLWANWYSGGETEGPENFVVAVRSDDDGATWSKPAIVIYPPSPVRAYDPELWIDPLGRLWLFWTQSHTFWDGRAGVWAIVSSDPDATSPTWSAPRRLCDGVMMCKPTVLTTGEWLLPASVWSWHPGEEVPTEATQDLGALDGSNVVCSTDNGKTWALLGQAHPPLDVALYDEHMAVERRDGSLWMLIRTRLGLWESVSADRGRTWSPVLPSAIASATARFVLRRLATGEMLLIKHTVPGGKDERSHLAAHVSDDDGATWSEGLLLDERNGVSYPDAVEAPDGTIYVIYDFGRYDEREIYMAAFNVADIRAGKPTSGVYRDRVLVDRSNGRLTKHSRQGEGTP